jgi:hypothetical protein
MPGYLLELWVDWSLDVPVLLAYGLIIGFAVGLIRQIVSARQQVPLLLVMLLSIPAMLIVQRVLPYSRVFMFALPVFFLSVAYGYDLLLQRLPLRTGNAVASFSALVVAVLMSLQVVSNQSVYLRPYLKDPQIDPNIIVRDIGPRLYTDELLYVWPIDRPFRYYMIYEGLKEAQARDNNNRDANGLYLVVPGWATLEAFIVDSELDLSEYTVPELISEYSHASVYYTTRLQMNSDS